MLPPFGQSVGRSFLPNKRKIYGGNIHAMTALSHSFKPRWNAIWENTLPHSESSIQNMVNDVNVLWVRYVNMPNTIFKATKAEEEKKISLRVMLRKKKNPPCRQPQEREWQTGSATGYYPMKGSRQAALRLSIFLKSGLPFENIPSLPPCNKQGLSTRIFSYNTPPLLGLCNYIPAWKKRQERKSSHPCPSKRIANKNNKSEHITHLEYVVRIIITWSEWNYRIPRNQNNKNGIRVVGNQYFHHNLILNMRAAQ